MERRVALVRAAALTVIYVVVLGQLLMRECQGVPNLLVALLETILTIALHDNPSFVAKRDRVFASVLGQLIHPS